MGEDGNFRGGGWGKGFLSRVGPLFIYLFQCNRGRRRLGREGNFSVRGGGRVEEVGQRTKI